MLARFAAICGCSLLAGSVLAQFEYRTLALSGRQAPGAPAGVTFIAGFGAPSISSAGQAVFTGILTGPGVGSDNDWGVYTGTPGAMFEAMREGEAAPGAGGASYFSPFGSPAIGADGRVVFKSLLTGAGVTALNDTGFYTWGAGSNSAVARKGDPAPGAGGATFGLIDPFMLSNGSRIAFNCLLAGAGVTSNNDGAVFAGTHSALSMLAREGDPAPGIGGGAVYAAVGPPRTSDVGSTVFSAFLAGGSVTSADDIALYIVSPGASTFHLRESDPIPGTDPGTLMDTFLTYGIASNGRVVLYGTLRGPMVSPDNDALYVAIQNGNVSVLLREGDPAPGAGAGVTHTMHIPYIHHSGHIAFVSNLVGPGVDGSNDTAVYAGSAAPFTLIAREGEPLPGVPGVSIGTLTQGARVNAQGDVAFIANLTGSGVNSTNDSALLISRAGTLSVLVREGDIYDVDDTAGADLRTVSSLTFTLTGAADNLRTSLGDQGETVFSIIFTDGSMGIFRATPEATPCPADTNGDGILSPADFTAWIAAFNAQSAACDQNGDSLCTPADFTAWIANYNAGC